MARIDVRKIVFLLLILVIFTFGIFLSPAVAGAAVNYVFSAPDNLTVGNPFVYTPASYCNPYYNQYTYQYPGYYQYPNPGYYQYPNPGYYQYPNAGYLSGAAPSSGINCNYAYAPAPVYVAAVPAASTTTVSAPVEDSQRSASKTKTEITKTEKKALKDKNSSLVARAIYGDVGFMPSGLIQWLLVAVLVLFIIILARIVFGGAKRYYSTSLKTP